MFQSFLQKRLFLQLYLFGCCCVVLLVIVPTGAGQSTFQSMSLELQLGVERVCHYETISLVCKHPDLNVGRDSGQYHFATGIPTWKQDGEIITVDSDVYSINHANRTHTHLIVAPHSMNSNTSLTFTCFVSTMEGTAVHSNIVTVYPGLRSPLPPQITSIASNYWSATIYWVHNATCFENCEFLVEWGNFIATTKATFIRIDRLKPGQHYKVYVTAQCTSRAPSHELRVSTKDTREFQTKVAGKGLSLELQLEERVCHYETISLVCKHPDLNVKIDDDQYHFITGTPTWKQDGDIITVDSVVYSINHANRTHTHLSVAPDSMNSNTSLTFTCFVSTTEGTAVHSNIVTVYPGLNSPLPPQITTIAPNYWTAAVYWIHNATCFEHCEFLVEWGNFTATTKATSIRIDRLEPGQHYKVDVTAQCTTRAPSHELRVSTKDTREFQTKDGPITLSLTAASNIACVGKTFILNCSHPPLDVITSTGEHIFLSGLPTWKINKKSITLDGSRFRATYLQAGSLLEVSFDTFPSFSLNQIFNFTCAVRLHNHTVVNSEEVSIRATEFPVQFHLGMGHSNFTIDWNEYSICVPNKETKQGREWFQVDSVPVNVETNQEEWIRKRQDFTTDYTYTFSKLDSTYAYKAVVSLQSTTNSDDNLKVTTNQTAVCLGDYYYLFCASKKPFGEVCGHSTVEWHSNVDDRIVHSNSTHMVSIANNTAVVLKFLITNQTQTYSCKSGWCMSNVVSVGKENLTGVPLPVIENITAGTRCINLTWSHDKTCCTNGKYTVSWQQWQSEDVSAHTHKNGSRMVDPADPHLNITPLNPGTMYIVTVSVECQSGELQSVNASINTSTISPTIAEATDDTVKSHPMLTAGQVQNSSGSTSLQYQLQVLLTADTDGAIAGGVVAGLVASLVISAGATIAVLG